MEALYQNNLRDMFVSSEIKNTQLLMFSSCHSGEIARIIQNTASIPYVIAVSS
jgi:hypothetical protein